jgi:GxxExxY protein
MGENEIGTKILEAAFRVHSFLGPGLLESSYEKCLEFEALQSGLDVVTQVHLPLLYRNNFLDCGYRIDMLVEDKVIVEIKAVEKFEDIHLAQLLTYLRLSDRRLGYLINFNVPGLQKGIKRVILGEVN